MSEQVQQLRFGVVCIWTSQWFERFAGPPVPLWVTALGLGVYLAGLVGIYAAEVRSLARAAFDRVFDDDRPFLTWRPW